MTRIQLLWLSLALWVVAIGAFMAGRLVFHWLGLLVLVPLFALTVRQLSAAPTKPSTHDL